MKRSALLAVLVLVMVAPGCGTARAPEPSIGPVQTGVASKPAPPQAFPATSSRPPWLSDLLAARVVDGPVAPAIPASVPAWLANATVEVDGPTLHGYQIVWSLPSSHGQFDIDVSVVLSTFWNEIDKRDPVWLSERATNGREKDGIQFTWSPLNDIADCESEDLPPGQWQGVERYTVVGNREIVYSLQITTPVACLPGVSPDFLVEMITSLRQLPGWLGPDSGPQPKPQQPPACEDLAALDPPVTDQPCSE